MKDNSDALVTAVTVLTVLAGFMIAIITIIGDPAGIPEGSWRTVHVRIDNIERSVIRHAALFVLYLLAIGLVFSASVLKKVPDDIVSDYQKSLIDYGFLFVGATSFFLTFALPFSLAKIQIQRIKIERDRRLERGEAPGADTDL